MPRISWTRRSSLAAAAVSTAVTAALLPTSATAAPADDPSAEIVQRALAAVQKNAAAVEFGAGQKLQATDTILDRDGTSHVRMDRTYRGLEVVGGDVVVHTGKAGAWKGRSQTLRDTLDLPITPQVKVADAELLIEATGATPRLAWRTVKTGTQHDGTPSRVWTYTDATTGKLIRSEERIMTVEGEGRTLYGGRVPLQLTQGGSSYQMKDPTRGNTYTVDVQNKTDSVLCTLLGTGCATGPVLSSPDTSFGDGTTANRESAAADAQYGTDSTWDYFQGVHGRAGIFGDGSGSYNRVHYGKDYVNAFWDGEKMTYGDGDGAGYGPLTSLDVAGHEMSHGVTENTANLTYSGESGGLNEATSDIFGTMVEFHAANAEDPADYLIGEEFDLKSQQGFRRMDDPAKDGVSLSCYTAAAGKEDVHHSSGIGNHFFYLLAEGSGAKTIGGVAHNSPTCDGSTVAGIGRSAAEKIWFRALTVYMTSSTTYAGARSATLNAARDLYGAGSTQYATVADAWGAVNVA